MNISFYNQEIFQKSKYYYYKKELNTNPKMFLVLFSSLLNLLIYFCSSKSNKVHISREFLNQVCPMSLLSPCIDVGLCFPLLSSSLLDVRAAFSAPVLPGLGEDGTRFPSGPTGSAGGAGHQGGSGRPRATQRHF